MRFSNVKLDPDRAADFGAKISAGAGDYFFGKPERFKGYADN